MSRLGSTEFPDYAEAVNQSFKAARKMMETAGYKIREDVKVSVDPKLPFMGYTMPQRGGFNIVVSGGAVGSGMLEGLLVHEMSHAYRIENKHPSHDAAVLEEAVDSLAAKNRRYDYQQQILHDLLNDIQDLYADDIAFEVFRATPTRLLDQITEFFQSMVRDEPVKSGDPVKDRWANASIVVHNARAISQMERHHVEDTGRRAANANQKFLAKLSPDFAKKYKLFQNTLTNLKEDMTVEKYRALLSEHLGQFVELAEGTS
jgi:GTP cyclohydrolase I